MKYLKRIQSKPSSVKARYAFLVAFSCTAIIAFIWSTTLPARFSHLNVTETLPTENTKSESTNSFTDIFNEAKLQVGNVVNWDEAAPENVTATHMDALSEPENQGATTSPTNDAETEAVPEETESTTTASIPAPEAPRTILIEVREKEPSEGIESEGQGDGNNTNNPIQ